MKKSKDQIAQNYRAIFNISPVNDFELDFYTCNSRGESDEDHYIFIETNPEGELIANYQVNSIYQYRSGSKEHYYTKTSIDGDIIDSGEIVWEAS